MRLAVTGATGRTGSAVVAEARERGHEVVEVSRDGDPYEGWFPGLEFEDESPPVVTVDDIEHVLADETVEVLVDFTVPEASVEYVRAAGEAGVPAVVGTTGFDEGGLTALDEAARAVPVLKAANFARGVQALLSAVREAVAALPGYDVELTETHHNGKRDAPSGTAKTILTEIENQRADLGSRVYGREGIQPREESEVGIHVRRAGNVRGEHEVLLAGNDEVVTVEHRAESRRVFAAGAVDAAEWLTDGRRPGRYDFADVVGGHDADAAAPRADTDGEQPGDST